MSVVAEALRMIMLKHEKSNVTESNSHPEGLGTAASVHPLRHCQLLTASVGLFHWQSHNNLPFDWIFPAVHFAGRAAVHQ